MTFSSSFISGTMLEMSWQDIRDCAEKGAVVLFPIAVVEEHGPHMTVSIDILSSYLIAREAQKQLNAQGIETVIAPPFYWGVNGATKGLPGSFFVSRETVTAMLVDLYLSLKDWGFKKIISIPGHGEPDHLRAIDEALKAVYEKTGEGAYLVLSSEMAGKVGVRNSQHTIVFDFPEMSGDDPDALMDTHAGAIETSIMLHYFPDHVRQEMYKELKPTNVTASNYALWEEGGDFFKQSSPLGYLGAPALADPAMGEAIIEKIVEESLKCMIDKL